MSQQTHSAPLGRPDETANTASGGEPFLTPGELEAMFKISTSHRLHLDRNGMPHILIGGKRRRYLRSDVEKFFIALTRTAVEEASAE